MENLSKVFSLLMLIMAGSVCHSQDRSAFDAAMRNMATGGTPPSQAQLDAMMANTRKITEDVGTKNDVDAHDAKMKEAARLRDQGEATRIDTERTRAESAEKQRVAKVRNANAQEEWRSQQYEKEQQDRKKDVRVNNSLPSKKPWMGER